MKPIRFAVAAVLVAMSGGCTSSSPAVTAKEFDGLLEFILEAEQLESDRLKTGGACDGIVAHVYRDDSKAAILRCYAPGELDAKWLALPPDLPPNTKFRSIDPSEFETQFEIVPLPNRQNDLKDYTPKLEIIEE